MRKLTVPRTIVECVPNFSEGRDRTVIDAIVAAVRSVDGVAVLDVTLDADHHRSVVTFAGASEAIGEAAFRAVAQATQSIDLTKHAGVHPRIGAADVVPFVPVAGVTLQDCVRIAEDLGARIWNRLGVPVYLYEAAARRSQCVRLENIRRGGFEGLREQTRTNSERQPDIGGPELHPTAGATVVGARKFLIAYNINLDTPDVEIARRIARAIRQSSGGLSCVKAIGVLLASRNQAQVSMNLTDFEVTPVHRVFDRVRAEAARYGVSVAASEIVGLIPRHALESAAAHYLQIDAFRGELVLENRLMSELE
jgi:glutamate formiminotransferase